MYINTEKCQDNPNIYTDKNSWNGLNLGEKLKRKLKVKNEDTKTTGIINSDWQ